MAELRTWSGTHRFTAHTVIDARTVDDVRFTWRNRPHDVDIVLKEVEAALAPFDARPHWGKISHVPGAELGRLYPRLRDARTLFESLDPAGRFSNHRLELLRVRLMR